MFKWEAIYDDGTSLRQFEGETEKLFKDIEQDKLIAFRIDDERGRHIIVDLKIGMFAINGTIFDIPNLSKRPEKYRLIYFKRVTREIGTATQENKSSTEYFAGYQITIDGKNHKVMFSEKDGLFKPHID